MMNWHDAQLREEKKQEANDIRIGNALKGQLHQGEDYIIARLSKEAMSWQKRYS